MPVVITADGPSLGGFVCPATIFEADLWKIGQVCKQKKGGIPKNLFFRLN